MKIGIDARLWNESGVGRYTRNLVSELQTIDRSNDYVLFVKKQEYENLKSHISNLKKWKLTMADIRWHSISEQLQFASIIKKEKLDLMHFPYFSIPLRYSGPFVITIHDLIIHHFSTGEASTLPLPFYKTKRLAYLYTVKKAAKNAQKIITPSLATKNEILNHLNVLEKNIFVTYEGIDASLEKAMREKIQPPDVKRYFLYVGNVYPHKNAERLIEAFGAINQKKYPCKLVFVGKEDFFYKKLKKKMLKEDIKNNIVFKHAVDDKELISLYKHAIALICPSLMEGFGLPALEAMYNKCLILASDIPVFKEVCKTAALYFNPYEKEELSRLMESVLAKNTSYFTKQKTQGRARAKKFSWAKMAKETLAVYNQCL